MKCPKCDGNKLAITETVQNEEFTYRRRYCKLCFCMFKSREEVFTGMLPSKKRLTKPQETEFQKTFATDTLKRFWK
jgi:transcriptional regulator NrdR family protein